MDPFGTGNAMENKTVMRLAKIEDLGGICKFVDYWLSGRGLRENAPGAVNDYFISPAQHRKYISRYKTYLLTQQLKIVGWAVIQLDGSLINLLMDGKKRGQGLGTKFLKFMGPTKVRSKTNQSSGDPAAFYEKNGYIKVGTDRSRSRIDIDKIRPTRGKIIDTFEKKSQLTIEN